MSQTRRAGTLRDHDLVTIDGFDYMVDWTVGLGDAGIRLGLIGEGRLPSPHHMGHRDFRRNEPIVYRGRA